MGTGYTRQSAADIVSGNEIDAGPFNAEFNQLRDAFDGSAGHSHDGSTGNGPKISLTTSISGVLPIARGGLGGGIHNTTASTDPGTSNDNTQGYAVGSVWINTSTHKSFMASTVGTGTATWQQFTAITGFQPLAANLTTLAALASVANLGTLAGLSSITNLSAIAGLTSAADTLGYFTGAGTAGTTSLTAFGRTVLGEANAAALTTALSLTIGTNTQAWDADLDALAALSGTNTIYYRSAASTWTAVTIGTNLTFSGGTLASTNGGGTVTTASVVTANGFAGTIANPTTAPAITISTTATGILKGNGTAVSAATAGTDYYNPGGTKVAIADGGTNAGTAAAALSNLGGAALAGGETLTGGFDVTSTTLTWSSHTVAPQTNNFRFASNTGTITITAPASDCVAVYEITNGSGAVVPTMSGFSVGTNVGDTPDTTSTHKFFLVMIRINSIATYRWVSCQ